MSRKHYERAAEIVRELRASDDATARDNACRVVDAFVELFSADNPRFDQGRFRAACRVESFIDQWRARRARKAVAA
jgi:hypothetical protein